MLVFTIASLLLAAAPSHATVIDLQKRSAVTDCLTSKSVPQSLPGTNAFNEAIEPFNLRVPFTPVAAAAPTTVAQVQNAILCGTQNNVAISPKSGGHSYASHGLGGENGHLMIDMKNFNSVSVDSSTGIATVGPGGRLGNIATSLYNQGQRAFSHGTCPGVGVGGHVLGGGYGYSSHTKGLAMDALVEATVVLANTTVVTASTTVNPDLFWALRGAGGSIFGIVTQYKFQTFAAPSSNTVFTTSINGWSATKAAQVHSAVQSYAAGTQMPAEMNLRLFVTANTLQLEGLYYGSISAFNSAIQPLSSAIGGLSWTTSTQGWIQSLNSYAYMSLTQPQNYDIHETFFSKSLMTVNLTQAALTKFWTYGANTAKSNTRDWYLIVDAHGGPTSAISKIGADATSYAHRNATLKYEFYDRVDTGSYPSGGQSFLQNWVQTILDAMPSTYFGMYMNYADTSLSATEAHSRYWLGHYDRLSQIKKDLDPKQAFSNPQAVWPAT